MQIPLMQIPTRLNFPSKCANHYLRPTFEQEMKNDYNNKTFSILFQSSNLPSSSTEYQQKCHFSKFLKLRLVFVSEE